MIIFYFSFDADVKNRWEKSSWGRKLIVQKKRASLNDFDRFKVMLAKIKVLTIYVSLLFYFSVYSLLVLLFYLCCLWGFWGVLETPPNSIAKWEIWSHMTYNMLCNPFIFQNWLKILIFLDLKLFFMLISSIYSLDIFRMLWIEIVLFYCIWRSLNFLRYYIF